MDRKVFELCSDACSVYIEEGGEVICSEVPSLCVYHCMEGRYADAFREIIRAVKRCREAAKEQRSGEG